MLKPIELTAGVTIRTMFRYNKPHDLGWTTTCAMQRSVNSLVFVEFAKGRAVTHPNDSFSKELGRNLAIKRAYETMFNNMSWVEAEKQQHTSPGMSILQRVEIEIDYKHACLLIHQYFSRKHRVKAIAKRLSKILDATTDLTRKGAK